MLWRFSPNEPISEHHLKTLTYRLSSASFLERYSNFSRMTTPIIFKRLILLNIINSGQAMSRKLSIQEELIRLLESGGFSLSKWASNKPRLPPHFSTELIQ